MEFAGEVRGELGVGVGSGVDVGMSGCGCGHGGLLIWLAVRFCG